jgi:hypothetical protein
LLLPPRDHKATRHNLNFFFFFFCFSSLAGAAAPASAAELGIAPSVRESATNRFAHMPAAQSFAPANTEKKNQKKKKKKKFETESQNN